MTAKGSEGPMGCCVSFLKYILSFADPLGSRSAWGSVNPICLMEETCPTPWTASPAGAPTRFCTKHVSCLASASAGWGLGYPLRTGGSSVWVKAENFTPEKLLSHVMFSHRRSGPCGKGFEVKRTDTWRHHLISKKESCP